MTRNFFAILLLALFLFNVVGYKLVILLQVQKADTDLEALINKKDYQTEDLFTLKIPIDLPYLNNSPAFERVDGEITVNHETYKFVQRKVANDTLYLQCIKHVEKNKLQQKSNDYFDRTTDITGNGNNKNSPGKNTLAAKYAAQEFMDTFHAWHCNTFSASLPSFLIKQFTSKSCEYLQLLIKPPRTV